MKTYLLVIKVPARAGRDANIVRVKHLLDQNFPGHIGDPMRTLLWMNEGNWARVIIEIEDYAVKSLYEWLSLSDGTEQGEDLLWFNDITKEAQR